MNNYTRQYNNLYSRLQKLYSSPEINKKVLFHNWEHIQFVHDHAIEFAKELGCNEELVAVSALLHDLNYIYSDTADPLDAENEIRSFLIDVEYQENLINEVIKIIGEEHIATRKSKTNISKEAMALSDADSLFRVIPTTPLLNTHKFLEENNITLKELANKIVNEQKDLIEAGNFFYTDLAKEKYGYLVENHLRLWETVQKYFDRK
jgi:uncharacterized protein